MGYFDALTSGAFKTARDGRRLFFPWGAFGRGYIIPTEQDYERLRRQIKVYMIVTLVLVIGASALQTYVVAGIITALLIVFYLAWAGYLLRGLPPSDETMSMEESMTTQAVTHSAAFLWAGAIGSCVFVAAGILMLVFEPDQWLIALASTVFFGLCAVVIVRMLILRSRRVPH
jgi:hypothetical protein